MNAEDYRGKEFPIHIELGDEGPVLDLGENGSALNLPESGCALVDFTKNEDGTLSIGTICFQGAAKEEEDEPMDLDEALKGPTLEAVEIAEEEDDEEDDE